MNLFTLLISILALFLSLFSIMLDFGWFQYRIISKHITVKADDFIRLFSSSFDSIENDVVISVANFSNRDILLYVHDGSVYRNDNVLVNISEQYCTLYANRLNEIPLKLEHCKKGDEPNNVKGTGVRFTYGISMFGKLKTCDVQCSVIDISNT